MKAHWTYKGINVYPAEINSSGIRWNAMMYGLTLKADCKESMRQLITQYKASAERSIAASHNETAHIKAAGV